MRRVGEQHSWGVTQFRTGRSKGLLEGGPNQELPGLRLGSVISSCRHLPLCGSAGPAAECPAPPEQRQEGEGGGRKGDAKGKGV